MLEAALFPRRLSSHFHLFNFVFYFMLGPDPEPETEAECITVPSQPRQKVAVTAIPGPQHCFYGLRAGQSCPSFPLLTWMTSRPALRYLVRSAFSLTSGTCTSWISGHFSRACRTKYFFSIGFWQCCGSGSSISSEYRIRIKIQSFDEQKKKKNTAEKKII